MGQLRRGAGTSKWADVRFGSKADIAAAPINVRFTPKSGHWDSVVKCPLCPRSRSQRISEDVTSPETGGRIYRVPTLAMKGLAARSWLRLCEDGSICCYPGANPF